MSTTPPETDPIHHTRNVRARLQELIDHLRKDVQVIDEPKAKALFETTAEALEGLRTAFEHYEEKREEAWK